MNTNYEYDAVVVGSGPNGLSAAITLVRNGFSVLVLEAQKKIGGGTRTEAFTEPGFLHDVCSAVHPMALASPFFRQLPLDKHGLSFIHPEIPLAHPLPDGNVIVLDRSYEKTASLLGKDKDSYLKLYSSFIDRTEDIFDQLVGPFRFPKDPILALKFASVALLSAKSIAESFKSEEAKALWAGLAAHSILPLNKATTSAVALVLGLAAHRYGWPIAKGGSQSIATALASYFLKAGGEIRTEVKVNSIKKIPSSRWVFFDLTPRQIMNIKDLELGASVRKQLSSFRYGPGIYKVDWALKESIPWRNPACKQAGTVHVGGGFKDISLSEQLVWRNGISEKPFVLLSQPSLFDSSRAPAGKHTAWAYCHVPHASEVDMTRLIEKQIERYAPGFRDCILARHMMNARSMEAYNSNYIGGDITGGVTDLRQLFTRPLFHWNPYRLNKSTYICSSSTPPGAGVHGLCGYYAASSLKSF